MRLRSIPFYGAGEYMFRLRGMPHEEMSLLLYTEGKKYLYAEYEGSPHDDRHELTHLQTTIEAFLVDGRGHTVCQGSGSPLHGDLNGNPNGWMLGGGDPAEYYHTNCLRVALKPSESYSLTIRIRDVDPQTPKINLTPVLRGGQLDLP